MALYTPQRHLWIWATGGRIFNGPTPTSTINKENKVCIPTPCLGASNVGLWVTLLDLRSMLVIGKFALVRDAPLAKGNKVLHL